MTLPAAPFCLLFGRHWPSVFLETGLHCSACCVTQCPVPTPAGVLGT